MKEKIRLVVVAALVIVFFTSCDSLKKYEKEEEEEIQAYLSKHPELNFEKKESGLYYLDVAVGTGISPNTHDTVYVFIRGTYLDGYQFVTNYGTTDTLIFPIGERKMIQGLEEGISYMKTGGKAMLLIPSSLTQGSYLPAYVPVLFEVDLKKIVPTPVK